MKPKDEIPTLSQARGAIRCVDTRKIREDYTHKWGSPGDPIMWCADKGMWGYRENVYIGALYVVESAVDGKDYYYEVKEYKDGWWRLEWPD